MTAYTEKHDCWKGQKNFDATHNGFGVTVQDTIQIWTDEVSDPLE